MSEAPILNTGRNEGGSLEVYDGSHNITSHASHGNNLPHAVTPPYQYIKPYEEYDGLHPRQTYQHLQQTQQQQQQQYPPQTHCQQFEMPVAAAAPPPSKIYDDNSSGKGGGSGGDGKGRRVRLVTLVLSCLLVLVIAGLVLVGALLGNKISTLEKSLNEVSSRQQQQQQQQTATAAGASAPSAPNTAAGIVTSGTPTPSRTGASSISSSTTSSEAAAQTTDALVAGYKYIGCYIDTPARILQDGKFLNDTLTNQLCADLCQGKNFVGTGGNGGNQCFCGALLVPPAARGNDFDCNVNCPGRFGQKREICGGDWTLSVWQKV
ncbi:hypothetical protein B0H63DRAFT_443761 [Podospora didyma]|uniref:WSC domain-containing protein n=1 Tax=Podospora didyma TaxID=330526 RepID=A0AAE0P5B1_9PEZI|nr:hypothetical protein B0H63DRAFT_443761 [Podospora didyma]